MENARYERVTVQRFEHGAACALERKRAAVSRGRFFRPL
jgi:hypothetical protein